MLWNPSGPSGLHEERFTAVHEGRCRVTRQRPLPCGPQTHAALHVLKGTAPSPMQRDLPRDSHVFGPLLKKLKCCGSAVFQAAANTLLMGWACGAYG